MGEVRFAYHTGSSGQHFRNVRLTGNWTDDGRQSETWGTVPMEEFRDETGCVAYRAKVSFAESENGKPFLWSIILDAPGRTDVSGIVVEYGPLMHQPSTGSSSWTRPLRNNATG